MSTTEEEGSDIERAMSTLSSSGKRGKFTAKQKAVLTAHYKTGMRGVGEAHSARISQAAKEAGLKIDQVKVAIHVCLSSTKSLLK